LKALKSTTRRTSTRPSLDGSALQTTLKKAGKKWILPASFFEYAGIGTSGTVQVVVEKGCIILKQVREEEPLSLSSGVYTRETRQVF
jgi:hypothetical protein